MSSTQPGTPPDVDDDAESRGLGPVIKPDKEKESEDDLWVPLKGHPCIEVNRHGKWRTVDLPKPPNT